ncbi:MAG: YajQ family cyclic di-GMP-binding protein [Chloroflexi bacterium]|jgi:cyclic-di-GMP-binding protein|nr:YajQ family cyclic di-GMP-binding protein [Chloroflexota bacterium]MCX5988225.1 YajQ family cyclic di-GMP-binding protein [Chloroflexota bacterium]RLT55864.1 MAG: YajQ family cyclic di-GMP-binding protein [Chloroflexota bacterium]
MAAEFSFDVVSTFDRQEVLNAIDQVRRELVTRFDLKDSGSTIELDDKVIKLASASELTLDSVRDLLLGKAVRRKLSPKIFDYGEVEEATKGTVRQTVKLRQGLSPELAREIVKIVRDRCPKLKAQIQGDAVRVTGKVKDDLQSAMNAVREAEQAKDWAIPVQFDNYR